MDDKEVKAFNRFDEKMQELKQFELLSNRNGVRIPLSYESDGDSDSTGAIAGNIVGAQVGFSGIPAKYTEKLELRDLIIEVADDLWHDCRISEYGSERDPVWEQKYIEMT